MIRVADVNPGDFRGDDVLEVSGSNPHLSESVGCEWLLKLDPLKRARKAKPLNEAVAQ